MMSIWSHRFCFTNVDFGPPFAKMLTCLLWWTLKMIEREISSKQQLCWESNQGLPIIQTALSSHLVSFSSPDPAIPLEKDRGLWEHRAHALRQTEMGLASISSCPLSLFLFFFSWGKTSDKYQHCIPFKESWCLIMNFIIISLFQAIKDNMGKSCKCHGVSGSCTIRVCWKTMPKMTQVATELRRRFDSALKVKLNRSKTKLTRLSRGRRGRKRNTNNRRPSPSSLVYAVNSPDFCNADDRYGILGTVRRTCNKTSDGEDGCRHLCCGRGYNTANKVDDVKCNCTFIWCCHVKCDWCKKEWIEHTCKWGVMTSPIRNKLLWIMFKGPHGFLKYEISRLVFYFSMAASDAVLGKQLWTITPETTKPVSIPFAVSTRIQRRLTHVDFACGYCEAWLKSLFTRSSNVSLENRESKTFF